MIAVALKGLLGRKTRAILTALAIVLGTGMVSATFIFTDTLNHAFNGVFSAIRAGIRRRVGEADRDRSGEHAERARLTGRPHPGRARSRGRLRWLPLRDGQARGSERQGDRQRRTAVRLRRRPGRQALHPARPDHRPLALRAGGDRDRGSDRREGALRRRRHDRRQGNGRVHHYTITGLAEIPGVSSGSATLAAFDVSTAQVLLGKQGRYDSIAVVGSPDVTPRRSQRGSARSSPRRRRCAPRRQRRHP
jgi:hypothetical protein